MEPCTQKDNISNMKDDIKDLKDQVRSNTSDINALKEDRAETKIYVKQIFERIEDLKTLFTASNKNSNSAWIEIVKELIKLVAIVGGIIAGVKLL